MCDAPRLLGRLLRERDLLHVVALLNLVDRVHALNHAAEDCVLAVESRLRFEADIELAAAGFPIRIDLVSRARGSDAAAQVLFLDLSGDGVSGAACARSVWIAALYDEVGHDAMPRQAVVEALVRQLLEIRDRLGRGF